MRPCCVHGSEIRSAEFHYLTFAAISMVILNVSLLFWYKQIGKSYALKSFAAKDVILFFSPYNSTRTHPANLCFMLFYMLVYSSAELFVSSNHVLAGQ